MPAPGVTELSRAAGEQQLQGEEVGGGGGGGGGGLGLQVCGGGARGEAGCEIITRTTLHTASPG